MKIKFQADADLREQIIWAVKRVAPEVDFQTANEAKLYGLNDQTVLAIAASQNRILISHDRRTMPYHFGEFIQNQKSPGVFIISQKFDMEKVVDDIVLIWSASKAEEWENIISELPIPSKNK